MLAIPQSTTRRVMLKLFATGTTTAATGKTVAVVLSKAGGAFANPSAGATNATELSSGWYYVDLSTTDTGTLGDLIVRGTATSCDDSERLFGVVKATTGGLTALPDAAAGANTGLPVVGTQVPNATAGAANGLLIAGSNAATTFAALTSTGAFTTGPVTFAGGLSAGLTISSTGSTAFNVTTSATAAAATFTRASAGNAISLVSNSVQGIFGADLADARLGNLDAAVSTRSVLTAANVWDLATSGHTTAGTFGAAMTAAASAGDPWATALPGSYASGTAGNFLGNNLTVPLSTVSTRVLLALPAFAPNANGGLPVLSASGTTLGYTVTTVTTTATATALASAERDAVADALLARNIAGGSSTGRTVKQAFAAQRNKVAFDVPGAGQFTVFDVDDSTPVYTGSYTASSGAFPVTVLDPA